jgi:cyclophilin family peptidyl-prolyl cis-trans isomerase
MQRLLRGSVLVVGCVLAACGATPAPSIDLSGCPTSAPTAAQAPTILADAARAVVATNKGSFTIELDPRTAPMATANFVALARCGFYAQVSFHRVVAGFVAQAGDPGSRSNHGPFEGLGNGGPGYGFKVEFPDANQPYDRYTVAMANALQYDQVTGQITGGTDTNGSQFFIDLDSLVGSLRPYYSVLGKVVAGTDVVDAIGTAATNGAQNPPTPAYVPVEPITIESVTVQSGG